MKYYKHSQLVKEYNVSDRTVRNWVEASLQGKVDLKLFEQKGRYYVADSVANQSVLEGLAEQGKKYRNSRSTKSVDVSPQFYRTFTPFQQRDIINGLEKERELSWHYSYFGGAADYWNDYLMELHSAGKGNLITNTIDTIKLNFSYLESLIEQYDHVNLINICTGNNIAIHDLVSRIKASGKLRRLIGVDISGDMLDIAEKNIERWFGDSVSMERRVQDIRNQPIDISENDGVVDAPNTLNIFLMVAGPLKNFRQPSRVLKTINQSMGKDDLLITTTKRDTPETRAFFDFNVKGDSDPLDHSGFLARLLNIDKSFYDVALGHDEEKRYKSITLKVNLSINFQEGNSHHTVSMEKGESILIWKADQFSDEKLVELLNTSGFDCLLTSQSLDQQLLLTLSRPKFAPWSGKHEE